MDIFLSIIAIIGACLAILLVIDKAVFTSRLKYVKVGMTGREIQDMGFKLYITEISDKENGIYYAVICSRSTIFKKELSFSKGKLRRKG